jgi:sialate O-acetylesterase
MKNGIRSSLLALSLLTPASGHAALKLPGIFSDHMVLQRDTAVAIWGTAAPSEKVDVQFAGQDKSATADADGKWKITLDPLTASAESRSLVVKGASDSTTLNDVLVGEVWLCAGDAALGITVGNTPSLAAEKSAATYPNVRCFAVAENRAATPQTDVGGTWAAAAKENIASWPAAPYLLGKGLAQKLNVPVGIIVAADNLPLLVKGGHIRGQVQGATIEAFMSADALKAEPAAAPILAYAQSGDELAEALKVYTFDIGDWKLHYGTAMGSELKALEQREPDTWFLYVDTLKKQGKDMPPSPPQKPTADSIQLTSFHISSLYNGMIAPLAGYGIRGIVWSQGAANANRAAQYTALLPALIKDWRAAWGNPDLPFVYTQMGRAFHRSLDPRIWSELRDAQVKAEAIPHTAMVATIDLPVRDDVWPADPATIGTRLAQAASALVNGEPATWRGPHMESVSFQDGKAIIQFAPHGVKLAARSGAALDGFAIAERERRWVYGNAVIDGDKVIVSYPALKDPKVVRYDWLLENRVGTLVDENGLPAEPFRSDTWGTFTTQPGFDKPNVWAETQTADLYPVVDSSLPRVAIIGDSIMFGYAPYVIDALKGKANVIVIGSGRAPAAAATMANKVWHIDEGDYAVIHYNDGLHSMPPRETDAQFEAGLKTMLALLKQDSPKVIWATITPAPYEKDNSLGPDSWNPSVLSRNEISKKVAADAGIEVDDLYNLVIGQREKVQIFGNLHFKPDGCKLMGDQVAAKILAALNSQPAATAKTP